ncbi:hypothetical protein F8M49_01025 [Rhodococcus zopfii]|uniref:Knr4/Smi1-like domain-containing protein n=1 Tax=Rhodococcus zopfii TaxID=43772 RepID=A0ABU3WK30_9NOCA|nr:hypothetical protein [Rhodococcus zopfii]
MTIVPSEFPSPDDVGELSWRISLRKPDNTFVPLAGRSDDRGSALRDMVVKAHAYIEQNPGPYSDWIALHVNKNYVQVQGVIGRSLTVEAIAAKISAAFDEKAAAEADRERRQREINALPTLSPTPPSSVLSEWERTARWLSANTEIPDDEFRVPRTAADELESAAAGWPPELVEFLRLSAGAPRRLLPLNRLMTPSEIADSRTMMLGVWARLQADEPDMVEGNPSSQPAGTPAYSFLPEYIPFAGLDGYFLFIDTRPGPMHGCVTEYGRETTDDGGPKWHSLSSMLSDLATSLETGGIFDRMWLPHIVDHQLEWQTRP